MFKGKIDIKVIFILILAGLLILSYVFRPTKGIDMYEDEINALREENERLLLSNDSIKSLNNELDNEIKKLSEVIDSTQNKLSDNEEKIKDLENGKGKVSGYVKTLNADGIAKSLTEYLDKRD
jgi:peptidoglycan hydrolase CwlO-like protein